MKSLKYAVIALLIVTICKKSVPSETETRLNKSELAQKTFEIQQKQETKPEKTPVQKNSYAQKRYHKRYRSTVKKYNPDTKIATVDNIYVGVYEYKQLGTPPNVMIPAMVPFGTITQKPLKKGAPIIAGKLDIKTLWGIPVIGQRLPIKELDKNFTLGYLWTDQDATMGIAQMNSGDTFVGVKSSHQPNYVSPGNYGPGGTGPAWTWYTQDEAHDLMQKYRIEQPSMINVKEIGIAKINRQRYKLYGIQLPHLDHAPTEQVTLPLSRPESMSPTSLNESKKLFYERLNQEEIKKIHPVILSLLAKNWLDNKK